MTSKERVLAALKHAEPDQSACYEIPRKPVSRRVRMSEMINLVMTCGNFHDANDGFRHIIDRDDVHHAVGIRGHVQAQVSSVDVVVFLQEPIIPRLIASQIAASPPLPHLKQ